MRQRRRTVGLIVAGCSVLAAGLGGCGTTETVTVVQTQTETVAEALESAPDASETEAPEEAQAAPAGATVRKIGGTGSDDGVLYRLLSVREVTSVPVDEYSGPVRAVSGAKLIRADMVVKNNTKAPLDPFCGSNNSSMFDQMDRRFDVIEDILNVEENNHCEDVAPGFQTSAILVFQVPTESKFAALAVWNDDDENDYSGESFVLFKR